MLTPESSKHLNFGVGKFEFTDFWLHPVSSPLFYDCLLYTWAWLSGLVHVEWIYPFTLTPIEVNTLTRGRFTWRLIELKLGSLTYIVPACTMTRAESCQVSYMKKEHLDITREHLCKDFWLLVQKHLRKRPGSLTAQSFLIIPFLITINIQVCT